MPIRDWTTVDAGIFHHFHHSWIEEIARALNDGVLPAPYYALAQQIAGGLGPDVLALQGPSRDADEASSGGNAVQLELAPPRVQFRLKSERDEYAHKAKVVKIRHRSDHAVVAVVEVVSPGNKSNRHGFNAFVAKAVEMLESGVHLLLIDLFPPGPRDPHGVHDAIWQESAGAEEFVPPTDCPLTLVSYRATPVPEAFVEPTCLGRTLASMPVFLTSETYVLLPLEATHERAWQAMPAIWRGVVEGHMPS